MITIIHEDEVCDTSRLVWMSLPVKMTEHRREPILNEKVTLAKWLKHNSLLFLTLIGVILGAIIGSILRQVDVSETTVLLISYPGEIYMRLLKLLILPLILSSLITGSSSVNAKLNGKIAIRTFLIFFISSALNALLGTVLAIIIHPGDPGLNISLENAIEDKKGSSVLDSLLDLGRNIISDNIFQATFQQAHTDYINSTIKMLKNNQTVEISKVERFLGTRPGTNNIGIVFFCIIFGSILGTIEEKGNVVKEFFSTIFVVIMKMVKVTDIVLVISQLGWFIATILIGVFLSQLIILQPVYYFFVRKNPFKYYLAFTQGTVTAFATASAAAALPVNFNVLDNDLKIHSSITRFVMPIGTNINMDGTALFLASSTVFLAQMTGFNLGTGTILTIWVTSTIMSFSSASVPSAALVLVLMIVTSMGIPTKDLPLLFAIDWLVDRIRTTSNMLGDCYTVAIVEKLSKKELLECTLTNDESSSERLLNKNNEILNDMLPS
ncbi:excitatory amino acid transporter-like isoform X3 [Diabrotica virgifera virgifera]|uniref:Amino acid transporter n=1 Tax=Diabrotica virgifera virgifera TaxID=50390 RepID=A0ABM5K2Y8_DIAVI|nr:excitatory amino acid transporter-like isoform X3 [Diabrotica virgifera virgifera]